VTQLGESMNKIQDTHVFRYSLWDKLNNTVYDSVSNNVWDLVPQLVNNSINEKTLIYRSIRIKYE
jgi:hypothetical protein